MPIARCVAFDHLPGNRAVAAIESDGEMVFAIAVDRPVREIAAELTGLMQEGIDTGAWGQTWDGPAGPPHILRSVS